MASSFLLCCCCKYSQRRGKNGQQKGKCLLSKVNYHLKHFYDRFPSQVIRCLLWPPIYTWNYKGKTIFSLIKVAAWLRF